MEKIGNLGHGLDLRFCVYPASKAKTWISILPTDFFPSQLNSKCDQSLLEFIPWTFSFYAFLSH